MEASGQLERLMRSGLRHCESFAALDARDREAIVAHLKEQLRNGDKSLVDNKGYRRYLKVEGSGHFVIDEKQVKAEERYDGLWVLRTNTVYNVETVAHVYKALWTV